MRYATGEVSNLRVYTYIRILPITCMHDNIRWYIVWKSERKGREKYILDLRLG